MLLFLDEMENVPNELSVFLQALVDACLLGILLNGPNGPQRHVGMLNLVELHREGLLLHKLAQALFGGLHGGLEELILLDRQRQTGQ